MYYHTYVAVYVVTHNGMDPGAAIVTRPSQKRQVFDDSPKYYILDVTCDVCRQELFFAQWYASWFAFKTPATIHIVQESHGKPLNSVVVCSVISTGQSAAFVA